MHYCTLRQFSLTQLSLINFCPKPPCQFLPFPDARVVRGREQFISLTARISSSSITLRTLINNHIITKIRGGVKKKMSGIFDSREFDLPNFWEKSDVSPKFSNDKVEPGGVTRWRKISLHFWMTI